MLKYDEIKRIITERFGFKTIEDYRAFLDDRSRWVPTLNVPGNLELLSPDNVDCIEFWKLCDDLFGNDPVCNTSLKGDPNSYRKDLDREKSNYVNLYIARMLGMLEFVREFAHTNRSVIEIGAGFGCFQEYIKNHTQFSYIGYDVVPRSPGISKLEPDGTFPLDQISSEYGKTYIVYSSNVFQHLSDRQREHYMDEAFKLLGPGGLFIFNSYFDYGTPDAGRVNGRTYCCHYGQFVPNMLYSETFNLLHKKGFKVVYNTNRCDRVCSFICQKPLAIT